LAVSLFWGQFPDLAESLPKSDHSEISFVNQKRQVLCRSVEADIMVPESEEKRGLMKNNIEKGFSQ
jgi:hypothetical protein